MRPGVIHKDIASLRLPPNAPLDWAGARGLLDGLPGGGLNIAWEGGGPPRRGPLADRAAIRWHPARATVRTITTASWASFVPLRQTCCAGWAVGQGRRGLRLCGGAGALLRGAWRAAPGAASRRSSRLGPSPSHRINMGKARSSSPRRRCSKGKSRKIAVPMPTLEHVLCVDSAPFREAFAAASAVRGCGHHGRGHRRSCTSRAARPGSPKGAVHVHGAVVMHCATGRSPSTCIRDDVFWCTRRPGLGHRHLLRHRDAAQCSGVTSIGTRPTSTPSAGTASSRRSA